MSQKTRLKQPTSPGNILGDEFLNPQSMNQRPVADHLGCDVKVVNRLINILDVGDRRAPSASEP